MSSSVNFRENEELADLVLAKEANEKCPQVFQSLLWLTQTCILGGNQILRRSSYVAFE